MNSPAVSLSLMILRISPALAMSLSFLAFELIAFTAGSSDLIFGNSSTSYSKLLISFLVSESVNFSWIGT